MMTANLLHAWLASLFSSSLSTSNLDNFVALLSLAAEFCKFLAAEIVSIINRTFLCAIPNQNRRKNVKTRRNQKKTIFAFDTETLCAFARVFTNFASLIQEK
jgi:hypothetical protein